MDRFIKDKSGGLLIFFAFLIIPLMAMTALAIDYSNMLRHKTDVMSALDASALATGKRMQDEPSFISNPAQVRDYAQRIFYANLNTLSTSNVIINATLAPNTITINATFRYDPLMMDFVGNLLGSPVNTNITLSSTVLAEIFQ